jgi:predicted nucleic acid-binding protein
MDKVFFDTNVLLDVLQKRKPFYPDSFEVINLALNGKVTGSISPISIADISYIARDTPRKDLIGFFQLLRSRLEVSSVNATIIDAMLQANWQDLEDSIQYYAAQSWGAHYLLTRNASDFPQSPAMPVMTPTHFLSTR